MPHNRHDKRNIRYRQFADGYAQTPDTQLRALLEGYRVGHFRRNEVRVYAARLEQAALFKSSNVSLYRIINCKSKAKGNRRLSHTEIQTAAQKLDELLPSLQLQFEMEWRRAEREPYKKPVARKMLRYVARGSATTVEALICFAYCMRRIPQRMPMQRLKPSEYYARFRYSDFEAWTGVHRATQSRIVQRLIARGYLNTAPVHKQSENCYGQVFIDGPLLSLVRPRQTARRQPPMPEKTSTPIADLDNAPNQKRSTLRNINPRMEIKEQESFVSRLKEGVFGRHADPDLRRMALRAVQIVEQASDQAA